MICTSITKLETLSGMDVLNVSFDDGTTALWFYSEALALEYVGKEVIVSLRNDMYKGNIVPVINTFVMPSKVNLIEKKDNVRLFCDQEDNLANLSFNEIAVGETKVGCIYYCVSSSIKSSDKSVWMEALIRDKNLRVAKLRIFNPENVHGSIAGSYCQSSLTRSEYGMQTKEVFEASGECPRNAEIDIAKDYVTNYFAEDTHATEFMNGIGFINKMENVIDYEKGYGLVRLAMELSMCEQMYNITNAFDIKLLEHAILTSYAHCCTEMAFSPETCNVIMAIRNKWPNNVKLISMLDPGSVENRPDEYDVMQRIKATVNTIIEKKKEYK